jgi:ERCC4-related helicase
MPQTSASPIAPGARVLIRDTEWLVRRVDKSSFGEKALTCVGVSELVRDKEAVFLTDLEARRTPIQVLDPAATRLVPDRSNQYEDSLLYLESLLRQTPPTDANIYIGHQAAMDLVPYQLDPALQALDKPRQRILIADAVGLGKTLEAGILVSELIRRGRGKRILVVTMKSMLTQFQKEFWTRFAIPLTRLDSIGLQRVRSRIPTNHNPFYYFDKSIISIDTLKQDNEFRVHLEKASWDIIVIDEAQNVAERGHGRTQRARLAKLLSKQSDSLIMLSATPHDGRARSFASLMNMLDPTAIANPDNYGPEDIRGMFIRRFKKDIQHQVKGSFQERRISTSSVQASLEEEQAFADLVSLNIQSLDKRRSGGHLFKTTLEKALFSSPAACLETIEARLRHLKQKQQNAAQQNIPVSPSFPEAPSANDTPNSKNTANSSLQNVGADYSPSLTDIQALQSLRQSVAAITPERFSRFQKLVELLSDPSNSLYWTGKDPKDRLVIFTERIATLNFLAKHLPGKLGLKDKQFALLHGRLSDIDQQQVVEDFGREESPLRLLVASDVASEGINLHYLSHRLIHFDIPWSLMVFQQRNGRIDRYGQEHTPLIHYLLIQSQTPKIKGDMRILDLLIKKDEEATKNIGDPSALMGVFDIDAEEAKTASALEQGQSAEEFETEVLSGDPEEDLDLLSFLEQGQETLDEHSSSERISQLPTLFEDDFAYARKALTKLSQDQDLNLDIDPEQRVLQVSMPDDLAFRFRFLPREIQPESGLLIFTDDRQTMQDEIKRCRKDEQAWPRLHYLWPLHPAMQWLSDRLQTSFGRHEAPVLTVPTLLEGEIIYLLTGIIPNRKGQSLIQKWFGVTVVQGKLQDIQPLETILERTGLGERTFSNPGDLKISKQAEKLLPDVVHKAQDWMKKVRTSFENELNPQLSDHLQRLEALKGRHKREIQAYYDEQKVAETVKKRRKDEKNREVESLFAEYMQWIEDTLSTEEQAYIKVGAVLQG